MSLIVDQTLAALADPNRRQIIELLCAQPLAAGELARRIGLSPAAISRHLRILKTFGMISEVPLHPDARVRVYGLRPQPMADLKSWLGHTEVLWSRQVENFKSDDMPRHG